MKNGVFLFIILLALGGYYLYDRGYFEQPEKKIIGTWVIDHEAYMHAMLSELGMPDDVKEHMLANSAEMDQLKKQAEKVFKLVITAQQIIVTTKHEPTYTTDYHVSSANVDQVVVVFFDENIERTVEWRFKISGENIILEIEGLDALGIDNIMTLRRK